MRERKRNTVRKLYKNNDWSIHLLILLALICIVFLVNKDIQLKGLYMDDLYLWSCYGDQSAVSFIFGLGGSRFRFVFNLISYLIFCLVGNHVSWFLPLNCLINGVIAATVYWTAKEFSQSKMIGFLIGVAFAISRFSYYQINMVYGLMESFALWGAIIILYLLFRYVNDKSEKSSRWFIGANICYFLTAFIHERYMVLLPILIVAVFLKERRRYKRLLLPLGNILLILWIRFLTIGSLAPAGTAGTDVLDTFRFRDAFGFAVAQVKFIFGINTGDAIFTGINWADIPAGGKAVILAADGAVLLLVVLFLYCIICSEKEKRLEYLRNSSLIFLFVAMCIASSSVTVRLEMRWIYSGYTGALCLLAYMYYVVQKSNLRIFNLRFLTRGIVIIYVLLIVPQELFYRSYYPRLYYWEEQGQYNSLAEETYGKYGDALFEKTIYILGNRYKMDMFTADTFFRTFHKEKTNGNLKVKFSSSIKDFGLVTDDMIILYEDVKDKTYEDVTDFVRNQKFTRIKGCYEDGWVDEHSEFELTAGSTGKIRLECYFPGELSGGEVGIVKQDGKNILNMAMSNNQMVYELQFKPYETVHLTIDNNFYVVDAKEQRGKDRMSMVVSITAD